MPANFLASDPSRGTSRGGGWLPKAPHHASVGAITQLGAMIVHKSFAALLTVVLMVPWHSAHAAPVRPEDLFDGCTNLIGLRSTDGIQSVNLSFLNKTRKAIKIIWIDYHGAHVPYKTLLPNQVFNQRSYVTHPWLVTDTSGNCLGAFVASQSQGVIVREPGDAASDWRRI